ncbi:glycosyltransferase family 2 protein [Glycocaulis sp.]|uniref:glycosyltransferase family 2 protein n=1 Tax=Glycocaulis sp. TaxID=1969725 RepID=UPI003D1A2EB9
MSEDVSVSVLIPTFRRAEGLARAVASVLVQTRLPDEIVIVDNDPAASAREQADRLAEGSPVSIRYVHEPRPGVANARNTGFATATGRFIAQLDDDEAAKPQWLESLLTTRSAMDCPIVFGPVTPLAVDASPTARAFLERLYARTGPQEDALRSRDWGCGNSLIDRARVSLPEPPFDVRTNEMGGEDDLLFVALQDAGVRFAWSAGAEVIEHVEGKRARWPHMLARSFAYGQGASQNCIHGSKVDYPGLLGWMAVGLGQAMVFGLIALPARLAAGPGAGAACLDKAVQGIGKLFWMESLAPRFYGAASRG